MMRLHCAGTPRGNQRSTAVAPRERRLRQLALVRKGAYRFSWRTVAIWVLSLMLTAGKFAPPVVA